MLKKPRTTRQSATRALTWGPTERQYDETLREAQRPINSIVTPRDILVIQHWNVNNDCAVALGWKPEGKRNRGRPKKNLASHCGEGERQATMENVCYSKTGSKQPPAVEGACLGIVRLLARKDSTSTRYLSRSCNTRR